MAMQQDMQLAVLIDAENVPYSNVTGMLEEITRYGTPTVKRIYGDWTNQNMSGWKNVLVPNAIMPVQQYCYTSGKNSSDSAMIIDAMDILYAGNIDGFCLVSSDSDFTRLATRLRESGKKVYGFGEKKTPDAFIAACDKFIYLEIIASAEQDTDSSGSSGDNTPKRREISKVDRAVIQLITNSVSDLANEDGWAFLGEVGSLILKKKPDFDSRNYGFSKLSLLVESTKRFELDVRERGHKGHNVYIRNNEKGRNNNR